MMVKFRLERVSRILKYAFLTLYASFNIYPLIWLFLYSMKTTDEIFSSTPFAFPKHFLIQNYVRAWQAFNLPRYFTNSVIVMCATLVCSISIALLFSYATARMKWKLATPCRMYVAIGLFIPVQVIMIPLILLIKSLHLTNSYFSLILPYVAFNLGFSTMAFYGFFRTIPLEYEEAASIDGAGIFRTFFEIIMPMVRPAIVSVSIMMGLSAWNEFPVALIMINKESLKTLPLGLINFRGQFETDWGALGATLVMASLPMIIMYLIFSRHIEKAFTGSGLKGLGRT